jgi:hypothetical protein
MILKNYIEITEKGDNMKKLWYNLKKFGPNLCVSF